MDFEAFTAGLEPGGLRNTRDIGILICYMLTRIDKPFSSEELVQIIHLNGMANFFDTTAAVAELIKCNNIKKINDESDLIEVTDNGKLISQQLSSELSLSVRQKAVSAIMKIIERKQIEKENPVIISKDENGGFNVNIRITDGMRDLMSLTIFVPNLTDANAVKDNFYDNPQRLYSIMLAAVTEDKKLLENTIKENNDE